MSVSQPLAIGVDLGATKIAAALVARDGRVLAARQTPTRPGDGVAAVLDRIAAEVRALLDQAPNELDGVGIGSPGFVDGARGVVRNAVNLHWDEVHLAREISQRLDAHIPVLVENDANVSALGEGMFGSARGSRDYVVFTVGSGLGSGAVSDGRLITGAHDVATDLGHYAIDPDGGRVCACGHRGCAETVVSGPGLVVVTRANLPRAPDTRLRDSADLTPAAIVAAARDGDSVARSSLASVSNWLGIIAAVAAAVVDPDLIIIGGGLGTAAFDLLLDDAQREMNRRLPPNLGARIRFCAATLATPALGGASLVWGRNP